MADQLIPGAHYIIMMPAAAAPLDSEGHPDSEAEMGLNEWIDVVESFGAHVDHLSYVQGITSVQFVQLAEPMTDDAGLLEELGVVSRSAGERTKTDEARDAWKANDKPRPFTRPAEQG